MAFKQLFKQFTPVLTKLEQGVWDYLAYKKAIPTKEGLTKSGNAIGKASFTSALGIMMAMPPSARVVAEAWGRGIDPEHLNKVWAEDWFKNQQKVLEEAVDIILKWERDANLAGGFSQSDTNTYDDVENLIKYMYQEEVKSKRKPKRKNKPKSLMGAL